ncbi:MAG: alanine--tRNA ligase [Chitinophagaceae bacterium]|nr:alanine--tRNA ligase [Chitinophagaceae bacterium]
MKSSSEIRQIFFDFFKEKEHTIVPSAPVVVKNDPTLLFTNAGMNQFKDYFLGNKPPVTARVADTQKCLRVSGKHNDLEEVGVDHYHHTMFEMLGNWSFGNATNQPAPYFKKEAIAWGWELLTKRLNITGEDLYVTVFGGDEAEGLPPDEESFNLWKEWVREDHILYGSKKDNFWEMGDTGPCGPCTEIHIDIRSKEEKAASPGRDLVNNDHEEVIEIWNIVFIQFNRKSDNSLEPLAANHVDTGMGFERLVRVLQGKKSNYDTDIFINTIREVEKISGERYEGGQSRKDIAFRVIADHIRAIVFPISDGQLPSNTGAGYVIRRILRRAVRYYFTYLNVKEPMLYKLVPLIATQFENVFPEPKKQQKFIETVIHEEENSFLKTLGSGLKRLEDILSDDKKVIEGAVAFELFDTYGFPIDLTQLIAAENNASVDMKGFEAEMAKQKERSRAATQIKTGDWVTVREGSDTVFKGYDTLETESVILRYRKVNIHNKESYQIVLDQTPFYAESGGQVGDTGVLISGDEKIDVFDTKKENDLILHFTYQLPSNVEQTVTAKVEEQKRKKTMIHHSATHLMHAALRKVLGTHVAQKGSLVNSDYLRFDFSHFTKVTPEELQQVEAIVNQHIRNNDPVVIEYLPKEEALQRGAMALFGEKYGDTVRVVTMDDHYSIELCGGTHVARTGDIGFFKIILETAVGAGVRRVEALGGAVAEKYIEDQLNQLQSLKTKMKNPKDPEKALDHLLEEVSDLKKALEREAKQKAKSLADSLAKEGETVNGTVFISKVIQDADMNLIREIANHLKKDLDNHVVVIASGSNGKASVAVVVSDAVAKGKSLDAGKIIKSVVAPVIKGGGGGNAGMATAGGQDISGFAKIFSEVKALL